MRTKTIKIVTALAMAGALGGALAPPSAATSAAGDPRARVTEQWAGYMTAPGSYSSVSAEWVHPRVDCTARESGFGIWVGLDHTDTVQQTGTATDCVNGRPRHYAWFEMYPLPSVRFEGAEVEPGDRIGAAVSTRDGRHYDLRVVNHTRGWERATREFTRDGRGSTAEVLVEGYGRPELPLADFGRVDFSRADIDGRDLRAAGAVKYEMAGRVGRQATTGDLAASGREFSVTWHSGHP